MTKKTSCYIHIYNPSLSLKCFNKTQNNFFANAAKMNTINILVLRGLLSKLMVLLQEQP